MFGFTAAMAATIAAEALLAELLNDQPLSALLQHGAVETAGHVAWRWATLREVCGVRKVKF